MISHADNGNADTPKKQQPKWNRCPKGHRMRKDGTRFFCKGCDKHYSKAAEGKASPTQSTSNGDGQKPKRKTGRPPVEYDVAAVETLGQNALSYEAMAGVLGIGLATVSRLMNDEESPFRKAYKRGEANANRSIAAAQLRLGLGQAQIVEILPDGSKRTVRAETKPHATMLIWLGKQRLGQTDVVDHTIDETARIEHGGSLRLTTQDEGALLERQKIIANIFQKSAKKRHGSALRAEKKAQSNENGNGNGNSGK